MAKDIDPSTGWVSGVTGDKQGSGKVTIDPSSGWISGPSNSQQKPVRPSQPIGNDTVGTPGGGKKKVKN